MKYLFIFLCYCSISIYAAQSDNLKSFVEENDLHLLDGFETTSNISEVEFKEILSIIQEVYQPTAKSNGHKLTIEGFWNNKTVNAYCNRQYKKTIVTIYGGLVKRPELTHDGLALIVCHEVAHAYGGKPRTRRPVFLISHEGQADYYGSRTCLKKVLPHLKDYKDSSPSSFMIESCKDKWGSSKDYRICLRQLQAGQSAAELLAFIKDIDVPDYETPDKTVVRRTIRSYPETVQCRLDTFFSGTMELPRPACWFRK
jgi:hypothetical protein